MRVFLWALLSAVVSIASADRWIQYGDHGEVAVIDGIHS
jgi:hypothetical protein